MTEHTLLAIQLHLFPEPGTRMYRADVVALPPSCVRLFRSGLIIQKRKRSKPSTPVCGVPNVQGNKKSLVDRLGNADGENKEKTEGETNKPESVKNR